jgi:hypothetical protein
MRKLALLTILILVSGVAAFTATHNSISRTEDCLRYNPYSLQIEDVGEKGWRLSDGRNWLQILDNREDAEAALALAQQHSYQSSSVATIADRIARVTLSNTGNSVYRNRVPPNKSTGGSFLP